MKKITVLIICCWMLIGCSASNDSFIDAADYVIGSGNVLPDYLQTEGENIVLKATKQSQYEAYWDDMKIENERKDIDFTTYDTYFIVIFGSSSCPNVISHLQFEEDALRLKLKSTGGDCTTNLAPTSYVLQVEKNTSQEIKKVIFEEGRKELEISCCTSHYE